MPARTSLFTTAAAALADTGWCQLPGLLSMAQTRALAGECRDLYEARQLQPARTGASHQSTPLRGDQTRWFEPDAPSRPQQAFNGRIAALRQSLSRQLMLGLVAHEAHYAVYRPGAGYARHLDCLRASDARVVSAVFYLNADWNQADGGALRLYLGDGSSTDLYPHAGTLALFLSARFEHEVLPARRERLSIACWMRQHPFGRSG